MLARLLTTAQPATLALAATAAAVLIGTAVAGAIVAAGGDVLGGPWQGTVLARLAELQALAAANPSVARVLFTLVVVLAAIPGAPPPGVLAAAGGALFGTAEAAAMSLSGAAAGASVTFLVARRWLRPLLARRWPGPLALVESGVRADGTFYLLSLRLVPMMPFTLVNLAAGASGMRLASFVLASLAGRAPMTMLCAKAGSALAAAAAARALSLDAVLSLGALAFLPLAAQAVRLRRSPRRS